MSLAASTTLYKADSSAFLGHCPTEPALRVARRLGRGRSEIQHQWHLAIAD